MEQHSDRCSAFRLRNNRLPPTNENDAETWYNWAKNQSCRPAEQPYPKSQEDLIRIVNEAREKGKKVRCAGTGHSWSSSSVTDGVLVMVEMMTKIYPPEKSAEGWTVQVETGVTVKKLDHFLREHEPQLAMPSNVVLESVRYGGVLSLGCHGAATQTQTLADLVCEVKIIDAHGNPNTFTQNKDPEEFSAACINLGLLGVIYSYTLRVEPMFNLRMTDTFPLLNEFTALELKTIVLNNDQTEIFYWPFNSPGLNSTHDRIWVKQWQRTTDPVTDPEIVVQIRKFFQNYETKFGDYLFQYIAAHPCSTPFLNHYVFKALEGDHEVVLQAPDAIHYQGGIDNVPCLDLEMAFKVDDNFENVVTAWKYVVEQLYEYANRGEYPFNLTMEMRFVKSSTKLMSNVYDEDPKAIYCTMEILSIKDTEGFDEFSGNIGNYWMRELRAQPHWAKMWEVVPGIVPYLRNQAHERYDRFNEIRRKYDPEGMFMNSTFAGVLNETVPSVPNESKGFRCPCTLL